MWKLIFIIFFLNGQAEAMEFTALPQTANQMRTEAECERFKDEVMKLYEERYPYKFLVRGIGWRCERLEEEEQS